jgi:perosamine synthetase
MEQKLPLFKTLSDEDDVAAVAKIIRRGTYWASGPEIEEFEKKIAAYVGTEYALAFNSGTSALHVLLLAHDVKGKEVIVPSFTFIATANAVLLAGGIPIFAESEDQTFGLDADDVEQKITKNTKAIVPLHYGGFPSRDIEKLRTIADKHHLLLLDDAAESLGSHINGKKVGTFGHSAIFSFCQNKVLSTGEGGMIVTDSREIFEKAKLLRSHGRVELAEDYFASLKDNDYIVPGYNYRMPTICAALGLSQFEKLGRVIALRRKHAAFLNERLSQLPGVIVPKELPGHFSVYQMYTIQLPDEKTRDGLQSYLAAHGIMSKVYFSPVHLKTIYRRLHGYKGGDLPRTEELSRRVLNIPLYPSMNEQELGYLVRHISDFITRKKASQNRRRNR